MKKKLTLRRSAALLLALLMLTCMFGMSLSVWAQEGESNGYEECPALWDLTLEIGEIPEGWEAEHNQIAAAASRLRAAPSLRDTIVAGMESAAASINISAFGVPSGETAILTALMTAIYLSEPQLFFYGGGYGWTTSGGIITQLWPEYKVTGAALSTQKAAYDRELAKAVAAAPQGVTDEEKALAVNDYFTLNAKYDYTIAANNRYDAYGLLVNKNAVCQGYAMAYGAVMKELGIPWLYARSTPMTHGWNVVEIDGEWYHVDVTWNDPVASLRPVADTDILGYAGHDFLLLSDDEISDVYHEHHGWTFPNAEGTITAGSDRFTDAFWLGIESGMFYKDGLWHYIREILYNRHDLKSYNYQTGTESLLYQINAAFPNGSGSYWNANVYLAAGRGDKLYYNVPDGIFSINFDGTDPQRILDRSDLAVPYSIYELKFDGCALTYRTAIQDFAPDVTNYTLDYFEHEYFQSSVTPPTQAAQGYTTYICTYCSHSYNGDFVPKLPTDPTDPPPIPGGCSSAFASWIWKLVDWLRNIFTFR